MKKWFENNPVGIALIVVCGLFVIGTVISGAYWSRPVLMGVQVSPTSEEEFGESKTPASELGPIGDYRVITERPLFFESRRPMLNLGGEELDLASEADSGATELPDVLLKGVIITPSMRIATIKPADGGDSFLAHEGVPLAGEYAGLMVSNIKSREATIESVSGKFRKLELQVNDRKIEAPPEVKIASQAADTNGSSGQNEADSEEDDAQPLSRAEEIRQRIAERREELRREQEQSESQNQAGGKRQEASAYQQAIRDMMKKKKTPDEKNGKNNNG